MVDTFRKVNRGDPLTIPAATYNAFVDAAEAHRRSQINQTAPRADARENSNQILVKNATGSSRDRFDVLGLGDPVFPPATNIVEFSNRPALQGLVPDFRHVANFAILAEPVSAGEFARAWVSGVCPVRMSVTGFTDRHADIAEGQPGFLRSGAAGGARIIWREPASGVVWALVRFDEATQPIRTIVVRDVQETNLLVQAVAYAADPPVVGDYQFFGEQFIAWPQLGSSVSDYDAFVFGGEVPVLDTTFLTAHRESGLWIVEFPAEGGGNMFFAEVVSVDEASLLVRRIHYSETRNSFQFGDTLTAFYWPYTNSRHFEAFVGQRKAIPIVVVEGRPYAMQHLRWDYRRATDFVPFTDCPQ